MEDEAQKMVGLKKAYAEIILNTAKEAAARVMAAERKALRYEHDLRDTKDEALRMMLRIKHMIDSKTSEAQMTSLKRETKIEVLEAQLQEAEDIITDLRSELKQAWGEMEMVNTDQVQPLTGQTTREDASFSKNPMPELITHSPSGPGDETDPTSCLKSIPVNRGPDHTCCNGLEKSEMLSVSDTDKFCASESDFPSIIMRRRQPELLRNGCTQRICAIARNLVDIKLPPSGYEDSGKSERMNELVIKASSVDGNAKCHEDACIQPSMNVGNEAIIRSSSELEENMRSSNRYPIDSKIIQKGKGERNIQSKDDVSTSFTSTGQPSSALSRCRTFAYLITSGVKSSNTTAKPEAKMKSLPRLVPGRTLIRSKVSIKGINKSGAIENDADKDTESRDVPMLINQGNGVEDRSDAVSSEIELGTDNDDESVMKSELTDANVSEQLGGSPSHVGNGKTLKNTFQRKRKSSSSNSGETALSKEKSAKRRLEKKEYTAPKPQMTKESSRDSRRLAQVARQLISLSGKKWCK